MGKYPKFERLAPGFYKMKGYPIVITRIGGHKYFHHAPWRLTFSSEYWAGVGHKDAFDDKYFSTLKKALAEFKGSE